MKSILRTHYVKFIISIVFLTASFFALFTLVSSMNSRGHRVIEARDRLATFEQNKRTFADEAIEFEKIEERINTLEQNILTSASIPDVLSSLEEMAKTKNVEFTITTADIISTKGQTRLHIDFSAEGTFENIEKIIDAILAQPYQVKFSRFSIYFNNNTEVAVSSDVSKTKPAVSNWQFLAGIDITSF